MIVSFPGVTPPIGRQSARSRGVPGTARCRVPAGWFALAGLRTLPVERLRFASATARCPRSLATANKRTIKPVDLVKGPRIAQHLTNGTTTAAGNRSCAYAPSGPISAGLSSGMPAAVRRPALTLAVSSMPSIPFIRERDIIHMKHGTYVPMANRVSDLRLLSTDVSTVVSDFWKKAGEDGLIDEVEFSIGARLDHIGDVAAEIAHRVDLMFSVVDTGFTPKNVKLFRRYADGDYPPEAA